MGFLWFFYVTMSVLQVDGHHLIPPTHTLTDDSL